MGHVYWVPHCICVLYAAFTDIKNYILMCRLKGTLLFTHTPYTQQLFVYFCVHVCVCVCTRAWMCDSPRGAEMWVIPAHMLMAVKGIHSNDAMVCDLQIDTVWWNHVSAKCQLFRKWKQAKMPFFQLISFWGYPVWSKKVLKSHVS